MSTVRKENSVVRFAKGTKTLPQLTHMYRPELHRQVTERILVSRLGQELNHLCQRGLGEAFEAGAMAQAKLELTELLDKMLLSLRRNRVGLDILPPVPLHCFSHWQVTPHTTVTCLIPVTFQKAKVVQKDIGHFLIRLPPAPPPPPAPSKTISLDTTTPTTTTTTTTTSTTTSNKHHHHHHYHHHNNNNSNSSNTNSALSNASQSLADVRTKEGIYVSPRKLHTACAQLVRNCLLKHGVEEDRIHFHGASPEDSDGLALHVALDCGWRAEFVPCVAVTTATRVVGGGGGGGRGGGGGGGRKGVVGADMEAGIYYVSRRFQGECSDYGDITWRPCFSAREQDVLHSISCTDNGLRLQAMYAICRLLPRDWRLEHFSCYDIQTVLLHDMDFHVDYSPRWQRNTLESCVLSMMKTLLYFVDRENLPHFDMNQLNLWDSKTQRQMSLARGALSRLLGNENAFVSLVRRATLGNAAHTQSVDFGFG